MLCDQCGERPATMVISQVLDGKQVKVYLCEQCANENEAYLAQSNPFEQFMGAVFDQKTPSQESSLTCPQCGMTIGEFKKRSKIGCANCYNVFKGYLSPIFKQIHGNNYHIGKKPSKFQRKLKEINYVNNLQLALRKSLEVEDYEEAARLRDRIKEVKDNEETAGD